MLFNNLVFIIVVDIGCNRLSRFYYALMDKVGDGQLNIDY